MWGSVFAAVLATTSVADAHGLFGHVHVTGWAIENMPPGELADFFAEPEVFEAALMGAAFPDTGYAVGSAASRAYGEHSHWEPFIDDFVVSLRTNHGPDYDSLEARKLIAFMMGAASHGLQDELFDSTFLYELEQRDNGSQENADPGTDGFLVEDGHARLYPGDFVPLDDLLPLYAGLAEAADIDAALINRQVGIVKGAYLNDGLGIEAALNLAKMHRPELPWAAAHYLDATVAGAHRAEILPTMRHMQALWTRLHEGLAPADLVVHTWPEEGRRLREGDADSVASWVTFVFGKGMVPDTATASLVDDDGVAVPFDLVYTRWGGVSRIVRFQPGQDLEPGGWYTATLDAGGTLVDGTVTTEAFSHRFQVDCGEEGKRRLCPRLEEPFIPLIEPGEVLPVAETGGCDQVSGASALALLGGLLVRRRGNRLPPSRV